MKKNISVLIALVLALSMVFSIAACGETKELTSSEVISNQPSGSETTEVSSEETSSFDYESYRNYISSLDESNLASLNVVIYGTETVVASMPDELPVYHDGDIETWQHRDDIYPENRKYRYIYYYFDYNPGGCLTTIRGGHAFEKGESRFYELYDKGFSKEPRELDEMLLVSAIKYFNITREEMEEIIDTWTSDWDDEDWEKLNKDEYHEIPNLDIIYTLDNDIINEYYRCA